MHPELIHVGSFTVYAWGFMLALAVIVGIFGVQYYFRQAGYNREWALDIVVLMVIGGVIGARLFYILLYQRGILFNHPVALFSLNQAFSGLVWYGGVAGALIPLFFYIRKRGLPLLTVADMLAPFAALGYGIVRIGCYLAGCCYGKVSPAGWGVVFPVVDHMTRYPTQLYSAALNFILAAILIWLYPRHKFPGQVVLIYLLGYSIYRFMVEFFRENLIMISWFSLGQIVTLVMFLVAALLYYYSWKKYAEKL